MAKNRENLDLTVVPGARYRNRSGVVELVGRGPLMFVKVENDVTKSCQFFRRKNKKNAIFWAENFPLQDRLWFARVDISATEFRQKQPK